MEVELNNFTKKLNMDEFYHDTKDCMDEKASS
jgi:hypothetical protein